MASSVICRRLWADILGVKIEHSTVSGLADALAACRPAIYDIELDPTATSRSATSRRRFIDYVSEHTVFAVKKGNPKHITTWTGPAAIGSGVLAGGSAEKAIDEWSDKCRERQAVIECSRTRTAVVDSRRAVPTARTLSFQGKRRSRTTSSRRAASSSCPTVGKGKGNPQRAMFRRVAAC